MVTIPVIDSDGNFCFNKYRMFEGDAKYRYDKGSTSRLYNTQNINPEDNTIYVTEGEFDAMVLQTEGLNAITTTGGAGSYKVEWFEPYRDYIIVLCFDADNAGYEHCVKLYLQLVEAGFETGIKMMLPSPNKFLKDVTDYYTAGYGDKFKELPVIAIETGLHPDEYREMAEESNPKENGRNRFYYDEFARLAQNKLDIEIRQKKAAARKVDYDGDDLNEIKDKVEIGRYVPEVYNKKPMKCFWHTDRNPSMIYNPPEHKTHPNTLHCFSCGAHKSVIDVVMYQSKCEFKEALEIIKKDIGK